MFYMYINKIMKNKELLVNGMVLSIENMNRPVYLAQLTQKKHNGMIKVIISDEHI